MRIWKKAVWDISGDMPVLLEADTYEYDGPLALAGGGKGGGGGGDSTTTTKPPAFQLPYLKELMREAQGLYQSGPIEYFPGQTVANFNPTQTGAQQQALQWAGGQGQQQGQMFGRALEYGLEGSQDIGNNPYIQNAIEAGQNRIFDRLQRDVLPGIDAGAIDAGGYGSSRQGIAQGLAIGDTTENALDFEAQVLNDAFRTAQDTFGRTLALAPQTQQAQLFPTTVAASIGDAQQQFDQSLIDAAMRRFDFEQQAPYAALDAFKNNVVGNFGGTSSATQQDAEPSFGQSFGAGLSAFGTATAATGNPWIGAAAGAVTFLSSMFG